MLQESVLSLHLPPGWGPQFQRRTQRYCYGSSLSRNQDLAPGLNHHLIVSPLFLYPLPSLISNCLDLFFETQGGLRRLSKVYILQARKREAEKCCTPEPHGVLLSFNSGNWVTMTLITSCQSGA